MTETDAWQNGADRLTVFVHIPRTAGTSFDTALRAVYGHDRVGSLGNVVKGRGGLDVERFTRAHAERPWPWPGQAVLGGHVPFGVLRPALPAHARYVTFLRDPVARTFSHFHNVMRTRKRDYMVAGESLRELLADGVYIQSNLQTRMLCDEPSPFGEVTAAMLEQAKANIVERVAFGLTERFDESLALLGRRLGVRFAWRSGLKRREQAPDPPNERQLRTLRRFNERDLELYDFARSHFERAHQELEHERAGVA